VNKRLLGDGDPPPVRTLRPDGRSDLLLTADHAGRAIPQRLGDLGLPDSERHRHIAWDIGIAGVTEMLSEALDAAGVLQVYSRLVIDCNRRPEWESAIPRVSELTKAASYPDRTEQTYPRQPWFARRDAAAYGVALDAQGKIAWGRSEIGGDPIVAVLTERVSDGHLAGLHRDGVSYIFAGERELDLGLALEILNRELRMERLLLEGGGGSNGSFLRGGLIDEISLAICPAVDGAKGAPSIFDSSDEEAGVPAPVGSMTLASCQVLEGGAVWLRYRLANR
jgi:riboflavin biosynthesis pyrimidine reductase